MAVTVDYSTAAPWLITVPKADLTLDTGTQYTLTVDGFWLLLRDFSDNQTPIAKPVLYSRIPATSSTPSITTIDLSYYQIQFEDGLYSVNIISGNTNIREAEVKNQVSVNTNNTTGFIDPTYLEFGTFDGFINVDETNGTTGQLYPQGTPAAPMSSWVDAEAVSDSIGLRAFLIYGAANLTGAELDFSDGHMFKGFSSVSSILTIDASVNVATCEFDNLTIDGTLDGNSVFQSCVVGNINYINGFIDHCVLNGTITLGGNANASLHDCWQQVGGVVPVIDMGGSGQQLSVAGFQGKLKLINCSGAGQTIIECSGEVELDISITSGTFTIYGDCEIINNTTGTATVIDKTTPALVWNQVIDGTFTAEEVMRLISSASAAKLSGAETTTISFRDIADSKNRIVATVDANGNRTAMTLDVSI